MNREIQLEELLDRWEDAQDAGQELDLQDLCRDFPELIEPLKEKVAAIEKINKCFGALQKEPTPQSPDASKLSSVDFSAKLVDLRFHDRGGLGVVYKAHDHDLNRDVAVKFLHQKIARNAEERRRFQQEAEITGRLDHPGVVPVYASGKSDGDQPFYVMRFIRGDTYHDAINAYHKSKPTMSSNEKSVALRRLLVQLVSVCQTIGYAHTRGIVHRDIKPKNIMLGKYGETLVVDWGLAIPFARVGQFRVKDEKTLVPQTGRNNNSGREGEGTPVFMSPEQAAGRDNIQPSSDIYSLGVVLYKAITGQYAFDGESPIGIKTSIITGKFSEPRKVDRSLPLALEAICLKAMELEPAERYDTAIAMANDLENFLADAPVSAYEFTFLENLKRVIGKVMR